jgi:3-oxoacyl-[acyl-carrier protein] reductase
MKSSFDLENKVAFITGSTRGIGWATAKLFAEHGAAVILNGVSSQENLDKRVDEIKSEFKVDCEGYLFDAGDVEALKNFYNQVFKKYKKLDILVNNAGILDDNLVGMISTDNIDRTINTNLRAVIYNLQYAARLMQRNKSGSIINIASIVALNGNEGQVVYGSSKAAVIGITRSASKELAPHKIRVNALAPGFINTDLIKNIPKSIYEERLKSIKMKRIGEPEDVAKAALFFASDLSEYVTGQVLGVDGGMII